MAVTLEEIEGMIQEGEDLSEDFMNSVANEMNRITDAITKISQETTSQNALTSPEFPQGADLLWLLSGGDVNAFTNYLRTYPGAGLAELSANPPALHRVIQHFQQNNPIAPVAESSDGISNTQLPSSNVSGMKYDPRTHKLLVRFHGENGEPVYQYDGVPENIAQIIYHGNASAKTSGKNRGGEW